MGGSELHQALRTICLNTDWNYAVFWKLKHRARMMLTWEDAYYDKNEKNDPSGGKLSDNKVDNLLDAQYAQDLLGLAVAKMSYYIYSLGEGVVGQVAVTGKHMWISGDQLITDSCSSVEHFDGWQTQLSAGIRTIAVVAVVPHGVVQLGSLKNIAEDLKLVKHIRDIFFELQNSLMGCMPSGQPCGIDCSPCLSDVSARSSGSGKFHNHINNQDRAMEKNRSNTCSPVLPSLGKIGDCSYLMELHGRYPRKTVEMINDYQEPEYSVSGVGASTSVLPISEIRHIGQEKQVPEIISNNEQGCLGELSSLMDGNTGVGSENDNIASHVLLSARTTSYSDAVTADNFGIDMSYSISDLLDSAPCHNPSGELCVPVALNVQMQKNSEGHFQTELYNMDTLKTSFKFPAGCELYEALGPAFCKQNNNCDWEGETAQTETVDEMLEGISSSNLLTPNSGSEHLLQAVIANVCHSENDDTFPKSVSTSVKSVLPVVKGVERLEPPSSSMQTSDSACYSFERSFLLKEDMQTNSEAYGSSQGFSSASHSRCSEQLERAQEPAKISKKRARPGESGRPRPRDRQLIQDRIKELRELVPNGSKCSIDSLLERTIKHMLFMQAITKHADKIDKCAESKLLGRETSIRGSSNHEQGSSWAMEVGNDMKVCPIIVENIGVNGQMLVEMMCEECVHFLEIAEAIRNLGLTILKGATESSGDKTWMCFVVEGQSNRGMHRMDILWSLVQILQSKTKT